MRRPAQGASHSKFCRAARSGAPYFVTDKADRPDMKAKNHWKPWTPAEENRLAQLAQQMVPIHTIAFELDRSVNAIRSKARSLGILLPLYNQRKRQGFNISSGSRVRTASAPVPNACTHSYR